MKKNKKRLKREEKKQKNKKIKKVIKGIFKTIIVLASLILLGYCICNVSKMLKKEPEKEKIIDVIEKTKCEISIGLVGIDTFNPIITKNSDVINILPLIYDSLFIYDKDMKLVNDLVDTYNYNGNELFIKLKKDIYWHDGKKLIANDVKFTIDMIKLYDGIYKEYVKNIVNVEVLDDYSFKIILEDIKSNVIYDLVFPIISYSYYLDEDFNNTDKNMKPLGTGKFEYINKIDNNKYIFKFNQKSEEKAQIETIMMINYESVSECFANMKNKKVDVIFTSLTNYKEYIGTMGYSRQKYIDSSYLFLGLNKDNEYLSNINVRKALNIVIDKKNIFTELFNEFGYVSQSVIHPNSYLYKNIDENYDLDLAKQYLINANYKKTLNLRLLIDSSKSINVEIGKLLKEQIEKLNIKIEIISKSHNEYLKALENKEYDIVLVKFNTTSSINMEIFKQGNYYDLFYMDNIDFNLLIDEINIKSEDLKQIFSNIQECILKEIPYIGIGYLENSIIYNTDILGFTDVRYNNFYNNILEIYKK